MPALTLVSVLAALRRAAAGPLAAAGAARLAAGVVDRRRRGRLADAGDGRAGHAGERARRRATSASSLVRRRLQRRRQQRLAALQRADPRPHLARRLPLRLERLPLAQRLARPDPGRRRPVPGPRCSSATPCPARSSSTCSSASCSSCRRTSSRASALAARRAYSYPPLISLTFLHFSFWALLVLMAAAWIAPVGPFTTPAVVDSLSERFEGLGVDFVRLAGPLRSSKVVPVHDYTGVLPFQGSIDLGERELLSVKVRRPVHRRADRPPRHRLRRVRVRRLEGGRPPRGRRPGARSCGWTPWHDGRRRRTHRPASP